MRPKRFLILFCAALVVAGVLIVAFAPLLVAGGLRLWMARVAGQQGLRVETERIEAPFLRPVIIHKLRVTNGTDAPFLIDCAAARLEMGLNLAGILTGSSRAIRTLNAETVTLDIRRNPRPAASPPRFAWPALENLLSDNFKLSGVQLHVENGSTIVDLRDATLTGSEMEAGVFSAKEVAISSPWFHKSFSNLHGATAWQGSRLMVGALSLMRGLDLDTSTVDLSHIGESSIGIEMNVDAFGGKIRARVSSDDRGERRIWDVAGNGSEISLAQMSDALEWTNRASGSLHACRFTFRGEAGDFRNATATLWAEVSGLTWRDRTADTVMMGAALYNRAVQVEQVYIKQRNNQLTLSGEFAWPERSSDWIKPAFRGDISASINDLGDFARLFGWSPSDFSGRIVANGSVNAREQKLGGQLSISGNSLVLFRSPIESLEVKLGLEESLLTITQLELRQQADFLRAEGTFALAGDRSFTATAQTSVADLANYAGFIPARFPPVAGALAAEWKGRGANGNDSGTWHARGRNLRVAEGALVPFEAELAGDYSPESTFFREFHLWNQRADFSAFITVAKNYFHAQDVRLTLNGRPRLEGNVYLPLSIAQLRGGARYLGSLTSDPFFDVDLNLEPIDLAELAAAVKAKPDMSGQISVKIQLSGTPVSLQGNSEIHLHDFVLDGAPALTAEVETRLALGMANFKATAIARRSDPVKIEGTLPLRLEKRDAEYAVSSDGPVSVTLNFPAIFLRRLPHYISRGLFADGLITGSLVISDSVAHPRIAGGVDVFEAKLINGFAISASARFDGRAGQINYANFRQNTASYLAHGNVDFSDLTNISLILLAGIPGDGRETAVGQQDRTEFAFLPLDPADCVKAVEFSPVPLPGLSPKATEIELRGTLFAWPSTIFLRSSPATGPLSIRSNDLMQTFPVCRGDEPFVKILTVGNVQPAVP